MIDYKWQAERPTIKSRDEAPGSLCAYNTDRRIAIVQRLDPKQSVEILGVYMNCMGTDVDEFTKTATDIDCWNEKMTNGSIYKKAPHTALHSTIYRSLSYRLPATQFTPTQYQSLSFRLHRHIQSKLGVNQKLATPYRYAPASINGLGLLDVRLEQYISYLVEFVLHSGRQTLNGQVTHTEIEVCQLHVGTEYHLWIIPYRYYINILPNCEIKYMLQENDYFQFGPDDDYARPQPQRHLDFFLMNRLFISNFSHVDSESINHCRLFLQMLTLADIAVGNGSRIDADLYLGRRSNQRRSTTQCFRQSNPPRESWELWLLAIDTVWTNNGDINPPLGTWLTKPQHQWRWYHDVASRSLFENCEDGIVHVHSSLDIHRRNRSYYMRQGHPAPQIPLTACPITITEANNALSCTDGSPLPFPTPPMQATTFHEAVTSLDEQNKAIIVVDGSFLPNCGTSTAAWIFAGPGGPVQGVGYSRLPFGNEDNDPYRSELFGFCLALGVLQVLHAAYPALRGRIVLSCDNDQSLRHGIEYNRWPNVQAPHYDILSMLHQMRTIAPFDLIPEQVTGHQDSKTSRALTRLEVLNIIADEAVRTMEYKIERAQETQSDLRASSYDWRITLNNRVLKKNIRQCIRDKVLGDRLLLHWVDKGKFTPTTVAMVDWDAIRFATKRKSLHHQRWATKFIRGFCGSYYKLHQMGKYSTPLCPRCELFDKTTPHILFCQNVQSVLSRRKAVRALKKWFDTNHTRWDIKETIVSVLTDLQSTTHLHSFVPFKSYDNDIFTAARHQDSIGVQNLLEGFISVE